MLENPPTAKSLLVGAVDSLRLILNKIHRVAGDGGMVAYLGSAIVGIYLETTIYNLFEFELMTR
jgi:hypothetical protein